MSEPVIEINARILEIERQRNNALTELAVAAGKLAVAERRVAELQKAVDEMKSEGAEHGDE